ncbi:MAG: DUF885 domain-containing protein [Planctomycetota bacterium]|jgi:uncharacterized protein (DUF885 family)
MRAALLIALLTTFAAADENEQILRLLADDLDAQMRRSPTWATSRGDRRFDDRLTDLSPAARDSWIQHCTLRLAELRKLDRSKLTPTNRTNAGLLEYELQRRIADHRFKPWQTPITQMGGLQRGLPELPSRSTFTKPKHFEDYLKRLEQVARNIDQTIADMREGLAAGNTPPRIVMGAAVDQALMHGRDLYAKDPQLHAMYPPFKTEGPLSARARELITMQVAPAFRRLGEFLRDEYVPKCRPTTGAKDGAGGLEYYVHKLKGFTTLPLSPQEIHDTGLAEVARIRKEMLAVIEASDAPQKDFAGFTNFLRTDKRFYFTEKEDLLKGYRDVAKRVDAWMPRLFGKLPRLAYGVKEMPGYIAAASPTAYYYSGSLKTGMPGYFVANTHRLDQRPKYEMVALTLHEAVPGHHHQIAIAQELENLPEWRTVNSYTAFGEGWALYSERLGLEMGDLYADPYDNFGRLSYEMWRAMRLVVDTGLHAFGWTREKAVAYMLDNSALTKTNVAKEVDRYIAWPGQATAYKIGELTIRRLRARAESELGNRFDVRAFHDTVLEHGSIPLPVLERRVEAWIKARKSE